MDRLSALETFVRVAETGSFSEAARRLKTSKSAVSRLVAGLEAELGVRLIHRTTRALTLTEAGRGYRERAARILADLADADQSVTRMQQAPRGRLVVNAPMSFGYLQLGRVMPDFLALYPDLTVDLTLTDRFVDLIDEGIDVAVRIGALTDSSLVARRLAPIRRVVCASPAYLSARGTPATPGDLAGHDCIGYSNPPGQTEWRFVDADGRPQPVAVGGRLTVNNGDVIRDAVLGGVGLALLPTFLIGDDLRNGRLVSVLERFLPQDLTLNAVYPHARHLSPKVRAFVDFLAQRFGPRPHWDVAP
jgi:DNA-binding transcriptional LysR family regulator